jgi:hypothetical protein
MGNLLTRLEAMQLLKIKATKFWELEKANIIQPAKIVGRRKRYDQQELLTNKLYY